MHFSLHYRRMKGDSKTLEDTGEVKEAKREKEPRLLLPLSIVSYGFRKGQPLVHAESRRRPAQMQRAVHTLSSKGQRRVILKRIISFHLLLSLPQSAQVKALPGTFEEKHFEQVKALQRFGLGGSMAEKGAEASARGNLKFC